MAQLGLKLEQQLAQLGAGEGQLSAELAARWGAEEAARERTQWRPVRSVQMSEEQAGIATARVVDIEDVEDFLVDLGDFCSPARLLCHCLIAAGCHEADRRCLSRCSVPRGRDDRPWSCPVLLLYPHQAKFLILQTWLGINLSSQGALA